MWERERGEEGSGREMRKGVGEGGRHGERWGERGKGMEGGRGE